VNQGLNQAKFKDLILYVSEQLADDPTFGETKLNKVLFFSDFESFRRLGRPITGAVYQRNYHGPTAKMYTVMRDELLRLGQLKVERRMVVDHVQDVLQTHEIVPNMTQFSEEERAIIDETIEEMRQYNNTDVSDLSHERSPGWHAVDHLEVIPYETARIGTERPSEKVFEYFRELHDIAAA